MEELIKPNWHIALIHFPIGLLTIGVLIEVFSFLGWRRSAFRWGGRWMVLMGAILAVPATFSGLYAMAQLFPGGIEAVTDPALKETLSDHLWMLSVATGGAMLLVMWWIALSDVWRDRLGIVFKLGLLLVLGLTLLGVHHGGDLVYGFKTGVHEDGASVIPTSLPAEPIGDVLNQALGAEQVHVVLAGFALAVACVCVGLSFRAVSQLDEPRGVRNIDSMEHLAAAFTVPNGAAPAVVTSDVRPLSINHTRPPRTVRLWFVATLLLLSASASGLWYLTISEGTRDIDALREAITTPQEGDGRITRRTVHVLAGVGLVADALLLMFAGAIARRSQLIVLLLAVPMLAFIAIQVWMGVLLVLEGPMGKLTGFGTIDSPSSATTLPIVSQ